MNKLYERKKVLFAVLWIIAYCVVMSMIKGRFGYESIWMLLVLFVFAAAITVFVKRNNLEEEYGISRWPIETRRYLFFIPVWILVTGNIWDGFSPSFGGVALLISTLSMLLVGYVEEMIFRGFLFLGMKSEGRPTIAIVISSITFGIGHIVNIFAGQATLETIVQILFAISWGFILTMVFHRSGSLLPCIIAHSLIDALSLYGSDNEVVDWIYICSTIVVAIVYCIYLARLGGGDEEKEQ